MDFKKNEKGNIVPQPNSSDKQSYFTESNAGHISVQTISPFRMRGSEFATEQSLKFNTDRSSNILGKKLPKDACSSTTSKLLIKQIIREHNLEGDGLLKEGHVEMNRGRHRFEKKCNYNQSFLINHVEFKRSAPTINSKHSSMQLGLCSREETIVPAVNAHSQCTYLERRIYTSDSLYSTQTIEQKQYAEKATYCRPVLNFNNEFVNKTREKNIRLQQLVKQLVLARKREKETEALNNYINELKSRHGVDYCDQEGNNLPQNHKCKQDDCTSNGCKPTLNRSSKCNELLEELYGACEAERDSKCSCPHYDNTYQCYPMSSQGRLMMLKKQRRINPFSQDWQYQTPRRPFHGNTIVVDRENFRSRQEVSKASTASLYRKKSPTDNNKVSHGTDNLDNNYEQRYIEFGTQTSIEKISPNQESMLRRGEIFIKDTLQEQYSRVSENVDRLKRKIQETVQKDGTSVLRSIENKLDTLITALNSYIQEPRPGTSEEQCFHCHSLNLNRNQFKFHSMNLSRSDTFGLIKTERLMCGLLAEKATKPIPYTTLDRTIAEKSCATDINKFLIGERENSNKVKNNMENNMLHHNTLQRSVQISLDIPTNERSTEVTNSLSKSLLRFQDRSVSIGEISSDGSGDDGRMAIAVNTDPLGLLALLKISSDTVKQFLSYMPNFPYHSYLQMIQFPQTRQIPHFVCNICGAAFERPSQLSDHIQRHDLGRTRDCCVCRHILDMASQRPLGLFRCQYCGQRFTRAYCCELHQETCAKRFGLKHDINPSLMLLR